MQDQNRSGFFVPPHPDVPAETHHAVLTHLTAEHQARAKRLIKRSQRVASVTAEYRAEVEALLGEGKYKQLRQYVKEALARQSAQLTPPKGLDLSREDVERLAAARMDEGDAFLRKLGTTPEALRALNQRFHGRLQKAARLPDERKGDQGKAVDVKDVPAPIRKHKTNPWTIRRAPFDGFNWFLWVTQNGNYLNYVTQGGFENGFNDPSTGGVGNKINLYSFQAGEHDTANVQHYSSVGFWYQLDSARANVGDRKAGKAEVWIEAQAVRTQLKISAEHLWSWSPNAWVDENNYMTLRATGEGDPDGPLLDIESKALVSRMVHDGSPNADWNSWFPDPGTTVWTHHLSVTKFEANTWIWIQIGTESSMDIIADDFLIDAMMDFQWTINSVQIRSSGDE